ncbi:MAG: type II/IV secretion system ATPase subunit, partial [Candidatus Aenigmarchaeota archaeon]|nr:type II/IV secretion system ATPase subunit [Candidatus Aenigmarchaeota archaeon]
EVNEKEKLIVRYYIERDFIGLGRIEPLMADENIEDISCDGVGIPIFVFHRNPKLGSIVTNIVFNDPDELDSFIHRLAQLCGKSISVATPLVGGSLPDGSRVQAALATDIARRGSNFTIRKFTVEPLTPIHLLKYGTIDIPSLAFLWLAVDFGRSVLVAGGTASGKTTLLNVLSLFIRPEKRIVSIEDTPELKLPHPHWVPYVARTAIGTEDKRLRGEIDLFDLLKESLRQRPDYIVVGEVRGREAYVLFQEMATGHPSLATIHAENINKLIDRLTTPPISLPASLIGSLDLVVFLLRVRYREKHVRKVNQIVEIVGIDPETKEPIVNEVFRWDAMKDKIIVANKSMTLKKIAEFMGLTEQQVKEELERRMVVLNWMMEKNITRYKDVYNVFNMYYASPEKVLASIIGGK